MARVAAADAPGLKPGETAWQGFAGELIYQRDCAECDRGLLYSPARFCAQCSGSGFVTRTVSRA